MRIVVKCPDCVESRVAPADVTIRNCVDDGGWSYRFTCPQCRRRTVATTVESPALDALAAGARLESWSLPNDTQVSLGGAPLALVDVLELHLLLLEPNWFDVLIGCDQKRER